MHLMLHAGEKKNRKENESVEFSVSFINFDYRRRSVTLRLMNHNASLRTSFFINAVNSHLVLLRWYEFGRFIEVMSVNHPLALLTV